VLTLTQLLARGDAVAVEQGRLTLTPASGRPVPAEWLSTHSHALIAQAASITGTTALQYIGYSVGNYGPTRAGGITLQFCCLVTGEERFVIFNAHTKRARTSKSGKAGDPLPKGQFRVGKRSGFYHFWESTKLPVRRLSDFHDYMGNLSGLVFTGQSNGERLNVATLCPLDLPATALQALGAEHIPDKHPTTSRQAPDKAPTRFPDKKTQQSQQSQQPQDIQPNSATGAPNYGNKVIREYGYTVILPAFSDTPISEQYHY
jgi:hypothetical protein